MPRITSVVHHISI